MLNADEICIRLAHPPGHANRLSIVPKPDTQRLLARGGTSVDLRLGRWFRSFKPSKSGETKLWLATPETEWADAGSSETLPGEQQWAPNARHAMRTNEHFVRFGDNFVLHPGRFVLGVTMEWLTLPRTLSGYVSGKSSLGRHGLVIETAAGLHPGSSMRSASTILRTQEHSPDSASRQSLCQKQMQSSIGCAQIHHWFKHSPAEARASLQAEGSEAATKSYESGIRSINIPSEAASRGNAGNPRYIPRQSDT
jgi:deoxycytidine triphosphate deaminase